MVDSIFDRDLFNLGVEKPSYLVRNLLIIGGILIFLGIVAFVAKKIHDRKELEKAVGYSYSPMQKRSMKKNKKL